VYFHHKLQQADSVFDGHPGRMGKITEIIEKSGINLTIPKAYFHFSATAVKRQNGSYAISVVATNISDIPANQGQFRLYFAPDVRLLIEPKGSLRDSTTTLMSARVVPFDSIGAHAANKMSLEFAPRPGSFPAEIKFFVLHFDYQCGTCGMDNYSHDLKFAISAFDTRDL
jgi:hypothetical protein